MTVNLVAAGKAPWVPSIYYKRNSLPEVQATDVVQGIKDGGAYNTVTAPIRIDTDGVTTISFTSVIWKASNTCVAEVAGYHTATVRMDRFGPQVAVDAKPAYYTDTAKLLVTAKDLGIGLSAYQLRLDNSATITVPVDSTSETWPIVTSVKGAHTVTYWAKDKLGHTSKGTIPFYVKSSQAITLNGPSGVGYNGKPLFSGLVTGASGPLGNRKVYLEVQSGTGWNRIGETTTTPSGTYSILGPSLTSARTFHTVVAGDVNYITKTSGAKTVKPKAWLTTPVAPTYASRTRYFTAYGYLKPRHSGYPVRIYKERWNGKAWVKYGYVNARALNYLTYTKYTVSMRLPYTGRWRLRAYHGDSSHYATWSSKYDYVIVR